MNTPRIASGYTTRANYHAQYRESHREQINAKKRAWRKSRKELLSGGLSGGKEVADVIPSLPLAQSLVETPTPVEQENEETGNP